MTYDKPTCGQCEHWRRQENGIGACLVPVPYWCYDEENISTFCRESNSRARMCDCFKRREP